MKVGIDARMAHFNWSGIRRYIVGLSTSLAQLQSDEDTFTLYEHALGRASLSAQTGLSSRRLYSIPRMPGERFFLKHELRSANLNVFHAPDFFTPIQNMMPLVFTIHDLYFLRRPESVAQSSYRYYCQLLFHLKNAARIICDSHATALDLSEFGGVNKEIIDIIFPGINIQEWHAPLEQIEFTAQKYSLSAGFLLMVGTIEPRKNHKSVFAAYKRRIKTSRSCPLPPLVVVGKKGYKSGEILGMIEELDLKDTVHYLGQVSDKELRALYHLASVLVYPSYYEGFGFPLLEAMATQTPVICSRNSSMVEVCGESAYYVDPDNDETLSDAIALLLENPDLRTSLVNKGLERVKEFSWGNTAKATFETYRKAGA